MSRLLIGYMFGALLLILIFLSDFYLSTKVKQKAGQLNKAVKQSSGFQPINWLSITIFSIIFWLVPFFGLSQEMKLEYRIILTLAYWTFIAFSTILLLERTLSRKLAMEVLAFLLSPALLSGLFIIPLLTLLKDL